MADPSRESLRRLLLGRRDATSGDYLAIASRRIASRLASVEGIGGARRVGAYYSVGSEVLTHGLIQAAISSGREVFLPRVCGSSMGFFRIEGPSSLEAGPLGTMEPKRGCPAAGTLDAVLVPAVGVAEDGTRLGYGRGYYDRFLAGSPVPTAALCLEKQVVRRIPRLPHDVPVDWVVTEERAFRAG